MYLDVKCWNKQTHALYDIAKYKAHYGKQKIGRCIK